MLLPHRHVLLSNPSGPHQTLPRLHSTPSQPKTRCNLILYFISYKKILCHIFLTEIISSTIFTDIDCSRTKLNLDLLGLHMFLVEYAQRKRFIRPYIFLQSLFSKFHRNLGIGFLCTKMSSFRHRFVSFRYNLSIFV